LTGVGPLSTSLFCSSISVVLCAPCRLASSYKNPASGLVKGRHFAAHSHFPFFCVLFSNDRRPASPLRRCSSLPRSKSLSKRFACSVTRFCLADIDALLRRQLPSPSIDYSRSDTLSRLRVADSDSPPLPLRISTSPPPRLVNRRRRTPASSSSHFTIELCAFSFIRGRGLFYLKNDKPRTHLLGHQDPAPYSTAVMEIGYENHWPSTRQAGFVTRLTRITRHPYL
jgi:hypothetical protein